MFAVIIGLLTTFTQTARVTASSSAQQIEESAAKESNYQALASQASFPGTGVGAIPDGTSNGTGAPRVVSFAVAGLALGITDVSVDFTGTHTWVVTVVSKKYSFAPQVVSVTEEMGNLNFTASP